MCHSQKIEIWELIDRYSSSNKLLRSTASCQVYINRLRNKNHKNLDFFITTAGIEHSKIAWMEIIQSAYFFTEINTFSCGKHLSKTHPITRLMGFIEAQDVLRVDGRLKFSHLTDTSEKQCILPRHLKLINLIIRDAHLRTSHGGTQLTLSTVRRSFWMIGRPASVWSFILRCIAV